MIKVRWNCCTTLINIENTIKCRNGYFIVNMTEKVYNNLYNLLLSLGLERIVIRTTEPATIGIDYTDQVSNILDFFSYFDKLKRCNDPSQELLQSVLTCIKNIEQNMNDLIFIFYNHVQEAKKILSLYSDV